MLLYLIFSIYMQYILMRSITTNFFRTSRGAAIGGGAGGYVPHFKI